MLLLLVNFVLCLLAFLMTLKSLVLALTVSVFALAGCGQPVEKAPAAPRPLKEAVAAVAADAGALVAIPAADLEDVLGSMLMTVPTPPMLQVLKEISEQVPRWIFLSSSVVQ